MYLLYMQRKDKKLNKIVNILEVLMYGEVDDQDKKVDLVEAGNDHQKPAVASNIPPSYFLVFHDSL
jgi:hypothetical protein